MSRLYVVKNTIATKSPAPAGDASLTEVRLVKADNPGQAKAFVTRSSVIAKYAEQQEIVDLLALGVKVEDATDPSAVQPTLDNV